MRGGNRICAISCHILCIMHPRKLIETAPISIFSSFPYSKTDKFQHPFYNSSPTELKKKLQPTKQVMQTNSIFIIGCCGTMSKSLANWFRYQIKIKSGYVHNVHFNRLFKVKMVHICISMNGKSWKMSKNRREKKISRGKKRTMWF